jgi:prepilin-type processing-associated H-X9-DG protein/prepilin-type N-terminal cleavage/methylation domain-containing protein
MVVMRTTTYKARLMARGVTLIEVVVTIAILSLLIAITLPAIQKVRQKAGQASCQNNMRQIGLALHSLHTTHDRLPPYQITQRPLSEDKIRYSYEGISWHVFALPHVEQTALWDQTVAAYTAEPSPWKGPHLDLMSRVVHLYGCPLDSRIASAHSDTEGYTASYTSYLAITGSWPGRRDGCFPGLTGIAFADITDGLSNTLMVGERPPSATLDAGWWYTTHDSPKGWYDYELPIENALDPFNDQCPGFIIHTPSGSEIKYFFAPGSVTDNCSRYYFWSLHTGGANFLFADGSVRFLTYSARPIMPALASRAGGETVELP